MGKQSRNVLAVLGIISTVLGVIGAVPSFLQAQYGIAAGSAFLVVVGLILLAISFGD